MVINGRRRVGASCVVALLLVGGTAAAPPATGPAPSPADVATLAVSAANPVVVPADDKAAHQAWAKAVEAYRSTPVDQVVAHPAAADFPGAVPADAPRSAGKRFAFARNLPRWQSTGLYAPPGERLTVRLSPADAGRGLSVVIGSHTDDLGKLGKWPRFPQVSRRFALKRPVTTVANAFGGLVYVDVPRDPKLGGHHVDTYGGYGWLDEHPAAVPGTFDVQIDGGVEAPLYRLGATTADDWARQRRSQTPWGELASGRVVLTVRTSALAHVDDPAAVLAVWDKAIDAEADLAGWPRQPAPPERVVLDREISAGWMHSGYPIMAHLRSEHDFLGAASLAAKGDWGAFHELGHNHEGQAYTFGGDFVEVDVNLFTMYVMKTVVGREMTAHPDLKDVDGLLRQRLGADGKVTPWTNLAIFVKTIDAFGWPPLRETLRSYSVPGGAEGIATREQKVDQWVLRYSRATGHDLSGYYAAFGLTCSDATRRELRGLPAWMPATRPTTRPG